MGRTRVLVVEDSLTVRMRLLEVLRADPEVEVVGDAADGRTAVALCKRLRPDVITLDMVLPIMNGLEVTQQLMVQCPTPIVIVSSSANRGDGLNTFSALAAGAVEVLDKPKAGESDVDWDRRLLATVKMAARIAVVRHLRGRRPEGASEPSGQQPSLASALPALVAVGASTGGPVAVQKILQGLPPTFPLPVLLVIHIGEAFGRSLAEWLDGQSALRVALAVDGEPLPAPGKARVVMAPPDRHLVVRGGCLRLTTDPERHSCRPSVDVLFESVASEVGRRAVACLLTGMGKDGAAGLRAVRAAGGVTIAQDQATSVVFGMPGEAVALDAAGLVLPIGGVAPVLAALALQGREGEA
jgi:two-component system chemotaxis response regulator CheB